MQLQKVSAAELSRRTGVPKQTISDWLAGTRPRDMNLVKRLAEALGTSIVALYFGAGPGVPKGHDAIEGLRGAEKLTRAQRRDFLKAFCEPRSEATRGLEAYVAEKKLISSASAFFFTHTMELMQVRGLMGYPVELSNSWETVLGWPLADLKERHWLEWIHPDDRPMTVSSIENFMLDGLATESCRHRFLHRSGHYLAFKTIFSVSFERQLFMSISWTESSPGGAVNMPPTEG